MPKFETKHWNNYKLTLSYERKDWRNVFMIIPFFWDTEIAFDLMLKLEKGNPRIGETLSYSWELRDLDGNVLKNSSVETSINRKGYRKYISHWIFNKSRAVVLGYLSPNKYYQLYIRFTDKKQIQSEPLLFTSFTTKDRGELYMQLFIALIVIIMGIFIGVMAKSCGL